jgi:hypothetical protein
VPKTKAGGSRSDGTASKIVKYVPVEVITISMLFFAAFSVSGSIVWLYVAIGALVNVLYLLAVAKSASKPTGKSRTPEPLPWFYLLSAVAYVLWAIATIDTVAEEAGLSGSTNDGQRAFVLTFAALSMPLLDTLFSSIQLPDSIMGMLPVSLGGSKGSQQNPEV